MRIFVAAAPLALTAGPAPDHFTKDAIEGNLAEVPRGAFPAGERQGIYLGN